MILFDLLRLLHFVAFGLLAAAIVGGWVLQVRYAGAGDARARGILLSAFRPFGLLSPVAIVLLLLTGLGQIYAFGFELLGEAWLAVKILCFLVAATLGVFGALRARARAALVAAIVAGTAPKEAGERLRSLDGVLRVFLLLQSLLVAVILLLSVIKPGR